MEGWGSKGRGPCERGRQGEEQEKANILEARKHGFIDIQIQSPLFLASLRTE